MKENRENIFQKLGRWVTRMFMGPAYEDRMYRKSKKAEEKKDGENKPDDSELIVSPGRQVLQRFFERKFAVISVGVVLIMFCVVFIGPLFMPKYYDAYTETTQKDLPPTMSFMKVPKELQNDIKMIDNYGSFTVGLSNSGKVYVWGITRIGATGLDVQHIPEEVQNAKIEWVSAGIDHIIAIDENGKFYGWGSNQFGQYAVNEKVLSNPNLAPVPDEVLDGVDPDQIQKVTSGYQASAILMQDGTLYIWGNKQAYSNIDSFIGKTNMEDVDFTLNYVVGLTKDRNSVFCGVRGLYNTARASIGEKGTKMTEFLAGRKIESVTATTKSICCLLDDGSVALVGDFPTDTIQVPTLAEGEYYTEIQGGAYHFTACTNLGHVYSWGGDHFYQAEAPTGKITNAAKVYTGSFQSYAVDENDQLLGKWGLKGYLFGTDDAGADIASRVVAGGRVTMTVGAIAVIIEILIGVTIGLISGYAGGWVDILLMRIAEVFYSIPLYPFMLILSSLLAQASLTQNQRLLMIMVILGVLGWPGFAYITRAQILVARESEYVTAAQAMGVKEGRIAFKHILPNIISVILVNIVLSFAASMQTETSLSFLGFGVMYPQPSWGNMLTRASNATAAINFWWQWLFTSIILVFTAVCINTIGDTIRDVMDPKSSNDK
ncbi:MAG: ABC transporter permease subunit [Oscillospiraceae bacterium]|nr:ABC transporter permease subunit [Oscillospiraceae bacterium]